MKQKLLRGKPGNCLFTLIVTLMLAPPVFSMYGNSPDSPALTLLSSGTFVPHFSFSSDSTEPAQTPSIQFTERSLQVTEDDGEIVLTVSITGTEGYGGGAQVALQQERGTAGASDFVGDLEKTISFTADAVDGSTRQIRFQVNDDSDYEGREVAYFRLTPLNSTGSVGIGAPGILELIIEDDDQPNIVINEIMADPDRDINGNGSMNGASDDEFVEFLNNESTAVDISGWTFSENGIEIRHTFPAGTIIPASGALLLFSRDDDGDPAGVFGSAIVQISDEILNLNNNGDTPTLADPNGNEIDSYRYRTEANENQSLVRSPEGSGRFVKHSSISGTESSPGTRADGTNFTNSITIQGNSGWRLLSAPVGGMTISDISDDTPIQGYRNHNSAAEKNFYVNYDGTSYVAADDIDNATLKPGKGFLLYLYGNNSDRGGDIPVTMEASTGRKHSTDVEVSLHTNGDGWNLLGNPFETTLDISKISEWVNGNGSLKSGVGQVWDDKNKSFVLTTVKDNKVAPWQGFFIENRDAISLDLPVGARVSSARIYQDAIKEGYMALSLRGESSSDNTVTTDKAAVLYFHEDASHGWDRYDASKLQPFAKRFALLSFKSQSEESDGLVSKAQDSRPFDFEGELSYDVELSVEDISGQFELSWTKKNIPENWRFTLIDNETGNRVDMTSHSSYSFNYAAKERTNSSEIASESEINSALPKLLSVPPTEINQPRFTIRATGENRVEREEKTPESVKLNPNYPNPFNPNTTISFELASQAEVKLNVYTIVGQKVATLVDGTREAGVHEESWNATDMPSGIYIAQLEVNGKVFIRKMTLIK